MTEPTPAHGAQGPQVDVASLYGRRNDERWNRVAAGDILERLSWGEPDRSGAPPDPRRPGHHPVVIEHRLHRRRCGGCGT
jgi:hypothetical protein